MYDYWATVVPTYIENWPRALCNLSIAQVDIPLTVDDAKRLGSNIIELGCGFVMTDDERKQASEAAKAAHRKFMGETKADEIPVEFPQERWEPADISDIRRRVIEAAATFPRGGFVRLGSRSPKDSWLGQSEGFKVTAGDGKDPLRFMLDCSERVADDLAQAIAHEYAPHIFVREWLEFPESMEFRCFMRGRKLVGISQYQYRDYFPELHERGERQRLQWIIETFFESQFRDACHLDDVVFDVFVKSRNVASSVTLNECRLIEINPFFQWTNPCLFDWRNDGDFDGSFRLNETPPKVRERDTWGDDLELKNESR